MMVCVAIYAALIGSIRVSSDIHSALFGTMAYTVILCFSLLKREVCPNRSLAVTKSGKIQ